MRLIPKCGVCGDRVIFASTRTDLAPGSSGAEDDLFAVDIDGGDEVDNLTDGGAGDDQDVFLCCNVFNSRVAFASQRTDEDNADGDVDIFTASVTEAGPVTNMTDAASGDDNDGFDSITGDIGTLTTLTLPPMPGSKGLSRSLWQYDGACNRSHDGA